MNQYAERNAPIIKEFRDNAGKVGGRFEKMTLLLLHAKGAKSGEVRTTPVIYTRDGDRFVIAASLAGADTNPNWYHNLKAHPEVEIEVGRERFKVRAKIAEEPERTRLFNKMASEASIFTDYQSKTKRIIPIVVLTRA